MRFGIFKFRSWLVACHLGCYEKTIFFSCVSFKSCFWYQRDILIIDGSQSDALPSFCLPASRLMPAGLASEVSVSLCFPRQRVVVTQIACCAWSSSSLSLAGLVEWASTSLSLEQKLGKRILVSCLLSRMAASDWKLRVSGTPIFSMRPLRRIPLNCEGMQYWRHAPNPVQWDWRAILGGCHWEDGVHFTLSFQSRATISPERDKTPEFSLPQPQVGEALFQAGEVESSFFHPDPLRG